METALDRADAADDALTYTLHPSFAPGTAPAERIAQAGALAALMATFVEEICNSDVVGGYIWQKDAFNVQVDNALTSAGETDIFLSGRMNVGDCIDDEWFAVWLLREVSKRWDVAISVQDSDGQFLLIEAADVLPKWVTPENVDNRVWIRQGRLHLIPLDYRSERAPDAPTPLRQNESGELEVAEEEGGVSLHRDEAVRYVCEETADTLAPEQVERAAFARIERYPDAAREHLHRAKAYLPVDIARLLHIDPFLISAATEAFYGRDALQLRAVQKMSRFPPVRQGSSSEWASDSEPAIVLTTVKMTRTQYAQLRGQRFYPPKIFGPSWNVEKEGREGVWWDLGCKIACGFEILYADSKAKQRAPGLFEGAEAGSDVVSDPAYTRYLEDLQRLGFFGKELSGSQRWRELEAQAAQKWKEVRLGAEGKAEKDHRNVHFAENVDRLLASTAVPAASLAASPVADAGDEDSDDFLNVTPEELDSMLAQRYGSQEQRASAEERAEMTSEQREEMEANRAAETLDRFAKKMERFIEGQGTESGALFEDEMFSDEEDIESDDEGDELIPAQDRQAAMDRLVPPLGPDEWGLKSSPLEASERKNVRPTTEGQKEDSTMQMAAEAEERPPTLASEAEAGAVRRMRLEPQHFDGASDDELDSDLEEAESGRTDQASGKVADMSPKGRTEEEEEEEGDGFLVNMGEEMDDFIAFARQALGLSDTDFEKILKERKDEAGGRLSSAAGGRPLPTAGGDMTSAGERSPKVRFADSAVSSTSNANASSNVSASTSASASADVSGASSDRFASFDAIMDQMEADLARKKAERGQQEQQQQQQRSGGGRRTMEEAIDAMDEDELAAMDAELKEALATVPDDELDSDADADVDVPDDVDYGLIKNFLESFKAQAQAGGPGPAGTLAARMGESLPRER